VFFQHGDFASAIFACFTINPEFGQKQFIHPNVKPFCVRSAPVCQLPGSILMIRFCCIDKAFEIVLYYLVEVRKLAFLRNNIY